MASSPPSAKDLIARAIFGNGVTASVATIAVVGAGAALVEAALIPGLIIGGAAVLAPRLLAREFRKAPARPRAAPVAMQVSTEFDPARAAIKTLTYRAIVTTVDFSANYFVIGGFAAVASLSGVSLVAGPIFYFAHEAAWHYWGPASARRPDPREAAVFVPIAGSPEHDESGAATVAGVQVSRALAKTLTYEVVTGVSEFGVNYAFVGDLAAAAGLTAFSLAVSPVIYYVHEKAWDYYDATRARAPAA